MVLAGRVPWLEGIDKVALQTCTASPIAWGSPWFDCVSVEAGSGKIWYAQLRMIFKIGEALYMRHICAFVRLFQEERPVPGDELAKHGCIPLTWEPCQPLQ